VRRGRDRPAKEPWGRRARRRLARHAVRRGLEGSGRWMAVGIAASLLELVDRLSGDADLVARVTLEPGETLEVRTRDQR
jgi:hypothetical protein